MVLRNLRIIVSKADRKKRIALTLLAVGMLFLSRQMAVSLEGASDTLVVTFGTFTIAIFLTAVYLVYVLFTESM